MKPVPYIILKFSSLLLLLLLACWWLFTLSHLNIPEFIPFTPIRSGGLALLIITLTTLIIAQKEILRSIPTLSIFKLTSYGTTIGLTSEIIFQGIRMLTLTDDKLYYFLRAVLSMGIFYTILSFLIAFQLKTKRTGYLILFIGIFYMMFFLTLYLFPSISR